MENKQNKDGIRDDRFTWKEGEVKFITPEENKRLKDLKEKEDKQNN